MLKFSRTVTMNGTSVVDGKVAATMYANLDNGNITTNITDVTLYESNKKDVRSDFAAFQEKVYEEQDAGEVNVNEAE